MIERIVREAIPVPVSTAIGVQLEKLDRMRPWPRENAVSIATAIHRLARELVWLEGRLDLARLAYLEESELHRARGDDVQLCSALAELREVLAKLELHDEELAVAEEEHSVPPWDRMNVAAVVRRLSRAGSGRGSFAPTLPK